jgi:Asp-tRNA(Asn)/Glu-tRNA(Gln) amidotransferase A subunit family amidase
MIRLLKNPCNSLQTFEKKVRATSSLRELEQVYQDFIERYKEFDSSYHFTEAFDEDFIYTQLENQWQKQNAPLFGLPVGVKDIFNTKVLPTSMGSEIWKGFRAGNNARIVDEICDKGGIIFCKTTTAEFAVHFITPEKTLNPHNPKYITGTSSSGSAVAVACGALPVTLGTQTAGSIIRPASFCGAYGFKPSFGALDRTGVLKTNDTLDTIGLIGADIDSIRKVFYHMMQKGKDYPFSTNYFDFYKGYTQKHYTELRIGTVTSSFNLYDQYDQSVTKDFDEVIDILGKEFEITEVEDVDFINQIHNLHEHIYSKSLSYYFKNEIQQYNAVSPIMRDMIARGEKIKTEEYVDAIKRQPVLRSMFDEAFKKYDFLITPSTATPAPPLHEQEKPDSCLIWTFLGYPTLSIPLFVDSASGLPYGLQIVAKKFHDFALLDFSESIENRFRNSSNKNSSFYKQAVWQNKSN